MESPCRCSIVARAHRRLLYHAPISDSPSLRDATIRSEVLGLTCLISLILLLLLGQLLVDLVTVSRRCCLRVINHGDRVLLTSQNLSLVLVHIDFTTLDRSVV